jgi:hypothetical protein
MTRGKKCFVRVSASGAVTVDLAGFLHSEQGTQQILEIRALQAFLERRQKRAPRLTVGTEPRA